MRILRREISKEKQLLKLKTKPPHQHFNKPSLIVIQKRGCCGK